MLVDLSLQLKRKVTEKKAAVDYLSEVSGLSKALIKKLMVQGAVWQTKGNQKKRLRIRRAQLELFPDDLVELYYDEKISSTTWPCEPYPFFECDDYGVWFKPSGVLSQGTNFGDHLSIERYVEKYLEKQPKSKKKSFLLHRLDREAEGLMIFAYNHKSAKVFYDYFQKNLIKKTYRIEVLGDFLSEQPESGSIQFDLDGKKALTHFRVLKTNQCLDDLHHSMATTTTTIEVEIATGRLHQIRRHFHLLDFPLMGDPLYGKLNKNSEGLKLIAHRLEFKDPFAQQNRVFDCFQNEKYIP